MTKNNINARDQNGCTALFEAVDNNNEAAVALLLKYNADCTIQNKSKVTPLQCATKKKYKVCAALIKKHLEEKKVQALKPSKSKTGAPRA